LGSNSNNRCRVFAGSFVISPNRWAARPVGAPKRIVLPIAFHSSTIVAVVKVLPQPGPPVKIRIFEYAAFSTVCRCWSDSWIFRLWVKRSIQFWTRGISPWTVLLKYYPNLLTLGI
jgi:hypothetical protein